MSGINFSPSSLKDGRWYEYLVRSAEVPKPGYFRFLFISCAISRWC